MEFKKFNIFNNIDIPLKYLNIISGILYTCKRYSILSQKLSNKNNIIKNKFKTDIRDINNNDFDILLKLLNFLKNQMDENIFSRSSIIL